MHTWLARQLDQRISYHDIVRQLQFELVAEGMKRGHTKAGAARVLGLSGPTFDHIFRRFHLTYQRDQRTVVSIEGVK